MSGGGASAHVHDSRVSKALGWFWGVVGTCIAGGLYLASQNLYQLNVTVARGMDSDRARDIRIEDHEQRLRVVERDLSVVEGRVFRGVDGYDKEPKRGN